MKTAFKYVFAVAFMVLLPFVSFGAGTYYGKCVVNASEGGGVYVTKSKDNVPSDDQYISSDSSTDSGWVIGSSKSLTFYAYAKASANYYFDGWYSDSDYKTRVSTTASKYEVPITAKGSESNPTTTTLYALFKPHTHAFNYTIAGDTISKTCVADGCPGGVGGTATLSIASSPTYTANPIAATTSKTGDVVIDGLSYATAAGVALGGAPTDVGDYKVTMSVDGGAKTLTKAFSIVQATIDSVTFNPASQNYDGSAKSTAMTVKAGTLMLGAGDYDITAGTLSGVVGSPAEDVTTTVTVQGKGNFKGEKSATWTIKAPSGSFAADAASGTGCTASGTGVTLTDSLALNPTYDSEKKTWKAAMTIAMPTPDTKESEWNASNGSAKYVKDDTTFVTVGDVSCAVAQSGSIPGVSFANAEGSYVSAIDFWNAKTTTKFTYLSSVTYTLEFSVADVEAAKASGKIEKSITLWSIVWSGDKNQSHDTGLKATTYTLTIPIDDKLILQDTEGRQIYPPHQHNWSYAVSEDGKTLVATCGASGCPQETLSFGFTGETAKTYDGTALAAQLTDSTEFVKHTGATIGAITYDDAADQPVSAGEHTAKVVIAVGGGSYTISQTMTINPAAFDLSLSISSVNYDGAAKTVTATAKFGQTTLVEGTDYDISGDSRTQTGSPASDQTYTVIATGKGNFANCEKSATWTIKAPSGSFAADAASGGVGCTASGTSVTLTDSLALNPTYDSEKGTWKVAMTVTWPAPVNVKYSGATAGHAEYIDAAHAFVQVGDDVYSGSQILDAGTSTPNLTAQTGSSTYTQGLGHNVSYTYFKSVTYTLEFSVADIEAAKASGKIEKSITVWSVIWKGSGSEGEHQYSNTGLKATTYTLTIPIDDKLILQDTEGRQIYPPHQHSWSYEIVDGGKTLKATCQNSGCPQETLSFGFTGATNKVYDSNAFVAELTDSTEFVKHTDAAIGEITYTDGFEGAFVGTYQASVVVAVGGKDYTLVETYTIDPRPLTSMTLSATSFDYDATEKSVTVAEVKSDTFKTGDYDIVEGSVLAEKGSGIENKTYTVTVQGKNNFCGTASATWTIKAPTGSVGAMKAVGGGCAVDQSDAKKVIVTDSTALTYSADEKKWSVGLNVAIPSSNIGGITDPTCTFPDDLFVTVSSNAVQVTKNSKYNDGSSRKYHYMTSVDAKVWFSVADVLAAKAAGLDAMKYTVTIFARKGQYNSSGLKEVTYTISIPLDGLVLNDEQGIQQYPEHEHDWSVAASGEPVNTLTATCSAQGCPQSPLTLALAAVSRDYNAAAFAATLTGADAFRTHVGATVGDITYWAGETQLQSAPKYTGSYEAHVVATVLGETYTLKAPFAITKPAAGYSDGYEVKSSGVRYDTWAEAVAAAAAEGDTIVAHTYKGEHDMVTYDFSSDKSITVDLCGQTLKQTDKDSTLQIVNNGTGAVTLTNGEFSQPDHQDWLQYTRGFDVSGGANGGTVVFGAGLKLTSRAGTGDGDQVPTVTAKNVALEIAGGQYQVRGVSAGEGGSVSITGGQFWSNFNPSAFVAQGYAVQEIEGDYKYEVVKASESIEEYVISVTGGDPNEVATWLKEKVSNLEAVKGCEYLKASFELDVDLITDATTVDITDFSMSDGFTFTITLDKDATPVVIKRAAEKVASRIRVTDALGTDFAAVDVERLTVDTESGLVKVAPKTGATSEFLKVLIEKDN